MSTPTLGLDPGRLATARSWAALAAALRVAAERSRYGGTAAALEQQATRCRTQFKRAIGGGIPFAEWDAERCLTAGRILRDAYAAARKGGAGVRSEELLPSSSARADGITRAREELAARVEPERERQEYELEKADDLHDKQGSGEQ